MTPAELDLLVAQISEEILARLQGQALPQRIESPGLPACACNAKTVSAAGSGRAPANSRSTKGDPAVAGMIDHTILKPEATREDVVKVCREALEYGFASVCVNPCWTSLVNTELEGSTVKVCTVIGFPFGTTSTEAKVGEAAAALRAGAQELDMVINVGALRSGDHELVRLDIQQVTQVTHEAHAIVKVILETALLDDNQKTVACQLAKLAGADFVKTSTGFGPGGATVHDVALMRAVVGPEMGVKASGGIRTLADFIAMKAAGATRIGASASVKIAEGGAA